MKNIKNHWEDVYTDVRVQSVEDYIAMKIMEKNQVLILITFEPITTGFNRVTHPVSYVHIHSKVGDGSHTWAGGEVNGLCASSSTDKLVISR